MEHCSFLSTLVHSYPISIKFETEQYDRSPKGEYVYENFSEGRPVYKREGDGPEMFIWYCENPSDDSENIQQSYVWHIGDSDSFYSDKEYRTGFFGSKKCNRNLGRIWSIPTAKSDWEIVNVRNGKCIHCNSNLNHS